jgi:hypothetical protein
MRQNLPIVSCAHALTLAQHVMQHRTLARYYRTEWHHMGTAESYRLHRAHMRASRVLERTIIQCADLTIDNLWIDGK